MTSMLTNFNKSVPQCRTLYKIVAMTAHWPLNVQLFFQLILCLFPKSHLTKKKANQSYVTSSVLCLNTQSAILFIYCTSSKPWSNIHNWNFLAWLIITSQTKLKVLNRHVTQPDRQYHFLELIAQHGSYKTGTLFIEYNF